MKIKRSMLEKIVREELAKHLKSLQEADEPKKDDKPSVVDADSDKKEKEKKDDKAKTTPQDDPDNSADKVKTKGPGAPKDAAPVVPATDDPADAELEKDVAKDDDVENAEEVTGGEIADQIAGKTVQSITMEPKSKIMPGAQEIVVMFSQIPDPLRILVSKTGQIKFFFRGLHNEI